MRYRERKLLTIYPHMSRDWLKTLMTTAPEKLKRGKQQKKLSLILASLEQI